METTEGFIKLREQVLDQVIPLLDSDDIPPLDRYELCLQIARLRGSLEYFEKAFHAAQKLEDNQKLNALMDLIGEIDIEIQDATAPATDEDQPSAETSEPSAAPTQ